MNNEEITSVNNELVKETAKLQQKKYREETKKFLLEGLKPIEEAFNSGIEIEYIFINKSRQSRLDLLIQQQKSGVILTTEAVLKKISSTESPPDAVAVAKQKIYTLENIKNAQKVILLENIKDTGNLGTILRTAKAFSQDAVILYGDTVDLYNPKCVRSAVGNLWKIPVVHIKDFAMLKNTFSTYERVATLPLAQDTEDLKKYKAKSPRIIMFGSEADGLSEELINFATKKITIKIDKSVESLNLSASVGIFLYNMP